MFSDTVLHLCFLYYLKYYSGCVAATFAIEMHAIKPRKKTERTPDLIRD